MILKLICARTYTRSWAKAEEILLGRQVFLIQNWVKNCLCKAYKQMLLSFAIGHTNIIYVVLYQNNMVVNAN